MSSKMNLVLEFISTHQGNLHHYMEELNFRAKRNGLKKGLSQLIFSSVVEGVSIFLMAWSAYLHYRPTSPIWMGLLTISGFIPLLANVIFQELQFERRIRSVEKQLPDSLILFASFPMQTSFEEAIGLLSSSTPEPIRSEWGRVHLQITKTGNVIVGLEKFGERMDSSIAKRSIHLLQRGYESGIPIHAAAASLAHDLLLHDAHSRERSATMLVEKYTLLLAGGLLVPILLGVMVGVVEKLPFGLISDNAAAHREIFRAALLSIRGYLGIYACLAGAFIGLQENAKWKMTVYICLLVPLAQIAYQIGKWWVHG